MSNRLPERNAKERSFEELPYDVLPTPECAATRRSAKNPDVWTRAELIEVAEASGNYSKSALRKKSHHELCVLLGWAEATDGEKDEKHGSQRKFDAVYTPPPNCNNLPLRSSYHPDAYTHAQLAAFAVRDLKWTEGKANRSTKSELCLALNKRPETKASALQKAVAAEIKQQKQKISVSDAANLLVNLAEKAPPPSCATLLRKQGEQKAILLKGRELRDTRMKQLQLIEDELKTLQQKRDELEKSGQAAAVKEIDEEAKGYDTNWDDLHCLLSLGGPGLREHQEQVVKSMLLQRGLLNIAGTGTGKTKTFLATAVCLLAASLPEFPVTIDIIVPAALKSQVENEKKQLFDAKTPNLDSIHLYSHEEFYKNVKPSECKGKILIIDEAHKLKGVIKSDTIPKSSKVSDEEFFRALQAEEDEPVNEKRGKQADTGKRSKHMLSCTAQAYKVLALTATAYVNRPGDLLPLILFVKPDFVNIRGQPYSVSEFEWTAMNRPNELIDQLRCLISFYMSDEGLPKEKIENITFEMTANEYRKYRDLEMKLRASKKIDGEESEAFLSRIRRASNELFADDQYRNDWLRDILKEGKQTVIYTEWKEQGVYIIQRILDRIGIEYVSIYEDVTPKQRMENVRKFNQKQVQVMVLGPAGGTGLNLDSGQILIVWAPPFSYAQLKQIEGRIRRRSNKIPEITIYRLEFAKPPNAQSKMFQAVKDANDFTDSIDTRLYTLIKEKKLRLETFEQTIVIPASVEKNPGACPSKFSQLDPADKENLRQSTKELLLAYPNAILIQTNEAVQALDQSIANLQTRQANVNHRVEIAKRSISAANQNYRAARDAALAKNCQ